MYSRVTYAEQEGITPRYAATFGTTWVPSPKLVINCTAGSGRWREESLPVTLRDGIRGTTLGSPPTSFPRWIHRTCPSSKCLTTPRCRTAAS